MGLRADEEQELVQFIEEADGKLFVIRNMNRILGIDHSRIVDLLQVFDISCPVSVPVIGNQFLSLKDVASRDPNCAVDHLF